MATPLDYMKTAGHGVTKYNASPVAIAAGRGEAVALVSLAGGLWLVYKRVITWHIPFAMLAAIVLLASCSGWSRPLATRGRRSRVGGAAMLGALSSPPIRSPLRSARGKLLSARAVRIDLCDPQFRRLSTASPSPCCSRTRGAAIDYARPRHGHRRKERK